MSGTRADARKSRESEAATRRERVERFARVHERRREVAQAALERVMDGASFDDADALLLAIEDAGGSLEVAR